MSDFLEFLDVDEAKACPLCGREGASTVAVKKSDSPVYGYISTREPRWCFVHNTYGCEGCDDPSSLLHCSHCKIVWARKDIDGN